MSPGKSKKRKRLAFFFFGVRLSERLALSSTFYLLISIFSPFWSDVSAFESELSSVDVGTWPGGVGPTDVISELHVSYKVRKRSCDPKVYWHVPVSANGIPPRLYDGQELRLRVPRWVVYTHSLWPIWPLGRAGFTPENCFSFYIRVFSKILELLQ